MFLRNALFVVLLWAVPALAVSKAVETAYLYPQIGLHTEQDTLAVLDVIRVSQRMETEWQLAHKTVQLTTAMLAAIRKSGFIDKASLRQVLNEQIAGFDRVLLAGPDKVRIESHDLPQSEEIVKTVATAAIQQVLQTLNARNSVIAYNGPARNLVFGQHAVLSARVILSGTVLPVRVPVQMVETQGEKTRYRTLWFDVKYEQQVWALTANVSAKDRLEIQPQSSLQVQAPQLALTWRANAELAADSMVAGNVESGNIGGTTEALRFIADYQAGRVLTRSMLEMIPAVDVGQKVTVKVESGRIQLLTQGIARQRGAIGEKIKVESLSSGEMFLAQVIDIGSVKVIGMNGNEG